jgi:hypothetical protein
MQDIVLVKTRDYLTFPIATWLGPLPNFEQCVHYHLLTLIRPVMESLHDGETASFAHTCHKCNTDSQIELVEFDSKIAAIMTRWLNLDPGLTKDDLSYCGRVMSGLDHLTDMAPNGVLACGLKTWRLNHSRTHGHLTFHISEMSSTKMSCLSFQDGTFGTSRTNSLQRKDEWNSCDTYYAQSFRGVLLAFHVFMFSFVYLCITRDG